MDIAACTTTCAICLEEHLEDLLYQTKPCGHFFHIECLRGLYVDSKRNEQELRCPLCREILMINEMDFEAFHNVPQPAVWQWALSANCAGFGLEEVVAEDWLSFPQDFQQAIEVARNRGDVNVELSGAGLLNFSNLSFTPVAVQLGQVAKAVPVRRCASLWKVSSVKRDDSTQGGYRLHRTSYYEPTVSQYIEQGYREFLVNPKRATIADPSNQYMYCFERKPSLVNPKLIAMFQWPRERPRAIRVITRDGDANTEPLEVEF